MTCKSCENSITTTLESIGVCNILASAHENYVQFSHDPDTVTLEYIKRAIADAGFDAEPAHTLSNAGEIRGRSPTRKQQTQLVDISIQFMTCQSCVKTITQALESHDGVLKAVIDLDSESGKVTIVKSMDPSIVVDVIEDCGFEATLISKQKGKSVNSDTSFSQPKDAIQLRPFKKKNSTVTILPPTKTFTLRVKGMTCASCVASIEKHLNSTSSIVFATVALTTEEATVEYIPSLITESQIAEMIDDIGFEAELLVVAKKGVAELQVFGMTCASCSGKIEREVGNLGGIESISVSLLENSARVVYNAQKLGIRDIIEKIEDLGFNALLADTSSTSQVDSLARTQEIQEWRKAFLTSLFFALPVSFISMVLPMFAPQLVRNTVILPGLRVDHFVEMILTIPVQFWVGWRFYKAAFKALSHQSYTMDVLITLGTTLSFGFSVISIVYSVLRGGTPQPDVFFETSATLVTFVTFGR
jgi:P-type Cu+ transporter